MCIANDYQKDFGKVVVDNICVREDGHKDKFHIDGRVFPARVWVQRSVEDMITGKVK